MRRAAGHEASSVREQREMDGGSGPARFLLFIQSGTTVHEFVLHTSRLGLPTSVNPSRKFLSMLSEVALNF